MPYTHCFKAKWKGRNDRNKNGRMERRKNGSKGWKEIRKNGIKEKAKKEIKIERQDKGGRNEEESKEN